MDVRAIGDQVRELAMKLEGVSLEPGIKTVSLRFQSPHASSISQGRWFDLPQGRIFIPCLNIDGSFNSVLEEDAEAYGLALAFHHLDDPVQALKAAVHLRAVKQNEIDSGGFGGVWMR